MWRLTPRQILLSTSEPVAPLRISASPIFDVAAPNSRASPSRSSSFPSYLIPYNFCSLQILVHKCVAHDVHELLDFRSWHRFRHQVRGVHVRTHLLRDELFLAWRLFVSTSSACRRVFALLRSLRLTKHIVAVASRCRFKPHAMPRSFVTL